jgi:hypothetical protein
MAEAKHLQAPVAFTLLAPAPGLRLAVQNRYGFLPLDHLDLTWAIKTDAGNAAAPLASGSLAVPPGLAAGEEAEVSVLTADALRAALAAAGGEATAAAGGAAGGGVVGTPSKSLSSSSPGKWLRRSSSKQQKANGGSEEAAGEGEAAAGWGAVWLEVTAALKAQQPWAPQGHVIATQSFPLDLPATAAGPITPTPTSAMPPLALASEPAPASAVGEDPAVLSIRGNNGVAVAIGKRTGRLLRYEVQGQALLTAPVGPAPSVVRACTDNDRAGFPVSATFVTPKWLCDFLEPYAPWSQ